MRPTSRHTVLFYCLLYSVVVPILLTIQEQVNKTPRLTGAFYYLRESKQESQDLACCLEGLSGYVCKFLHSDGNTGDGIGFAV